MTELTKSVGADDSAPGVTAIEGSAQPSVRELLTELAALEDATRVPTARTRERLVALAREQEIIEELRRRCPEGSQPS
jgi:hypothetical protein